MPRLALILIIFKYLLCLTQNGTTQSLLDALYHFYWYCWLAKTHQLFSYTAAAVVQVSHGSGGSRRSHCHLVVDSQDGGWWGVLRSRLLPPPRWWWRWWFEPPALGPDRWASRTGAGFCEGWDEVWPPRRSVRQLRLPGAWGRMPCCWDDTEVGATEGWELDVLSGTCGSKLWNI